MSINRLNAETPDHVSYTIRNMVQGAEEHSVRYQEAAQHIRTALSAKGLYEAPPNESADMIVEVDYGIAPPRVKLIEYSRTVLSVPRVGADVPSVSDEPRRVIGHEEFARAVVVREKHLSICGRDNKPPTATAPPAEIWRVEVSIEDTGNDLRGYLPILASVAMDEIGSNTDGVTTTRIGGNDEAIRFIKKGL
jgi:hypothetical protein